MSKTAFTVLVLPLAFLSSSLRAQNDSLPDKSQYTLFKPTPRSEMRDWRTDHAGVSPYTVDAGHFELEVSALSYAYQSVNMFFFSGAIIDREFWAYGETILKAGLLNRLDLEFAFTPYERFSTRFVSFFTGTPSTATVQGFGDSAARLKWNISGDDKGKTALSASGVVFFPTASAGLGSDQYAGGPALEFAAQLPWDFELRIDTRATFYQDSLSQRQTSFENLASLSHHIIGGLSAYAMFDTYAYTQGVEWLGYCKTGFNYRLAANVEFFSGAFFGVHGPAWDYNPFVGLGARF